MLDEGWEPEDDESPLSDTERQISAEWLASVMSTQIELSERIRGGASVVLATCSIASTLLDDRPKLSDAFDWVILEEAAKAWPTELIIPLTLGTRWTLIGDHRQLGAHRSEDVARFLDTLRIQPNDKVRLHYDARVKRLEVLNLFRTLFAPSATGPDGGADRSWIVPAQRGDALGRLSTQFRMHADIAEPVRRAFYPTVPAAFDQYGLPTSFLESHESASKDHGVHRPEYLAGRSLVWIDTGSQPRCEDQPMWSNAGEVDLVEQLVAQMVRRQPPRVPMTRTTLQS